MDTTGLAPGNYYAEAYMGMTWRKEPNAPATHHVSAPGWTEIPRDLALRFVLTGDPAPAIDLARSGQVKLQRMPGVSWDLPVQGQCQSR